MKTYTRRAVLGSGLAAAITPLRAGTVIAGSVLFEGSAFAANDTSDFVLDHAGREMVRLHTRGDLPRASTLALASANLRLLAAHPSVVKAHKSMDGVEAESLNSDQAFRNLRRSLQARHGYTGTVQDLRNLVIDAPADVAPSVLKDVKAGRAPLLLTKVADRLEAMALRLDTTGLNGVGFKERAFTPLIQPVWDIGEGGVPPCVTLGVMQYGIMGIAIVFSMGGAGVVVGGVLAGIGLILQIIRWGAC
jgi:hypothetical protein